ncbi:DUF3099 domain-containing protein [Nocardia camponoti]|uniref:DUF3099 domain-containing protein n=1 Tax=Nocardia camponoti TaxID=1616106 RepID=A0A917V5W4_9NOCA|nr:DUF3099 domain-containing protein [Nocardia camponoti]GGK41243.1 hypothetical protein GCM10011591_10950 [Nocardia camponoti]
MRDNGDVPGADENPEVTVPTPPADTPGVRRSFASSDPRHAVLITEAAPSLEDQHRARVRRYMLIMGLRIPCLVLAAISYVTFESPLLAILIMLASVPLPWIAVLIANDRPPRDKTEPSRWDGRDAQLQLEARKHNIIE